MTGPVKRRLRHVGTAVALAVACGLLYTPAAVTPASATAKVKDLTVRAMTFNILNAGTHHQDGVPDKDLTWAARDDQVAAYVRWNSPDVVGFQENEVTVTLPDGTRCRQLCTIASTKLSDYRFVQIDGDVPIAFRKAKFTMQSTGSKQVAWKGKDGATRDRWLTWVVLTDRFTGRTFIAANTHTISGDASARVTSRTVQTRNVLAQLNAINPNLATPFVLLGDWNMKDTATGAEHQPATLLSSENVIDSAPSAVRTNDEVPEAASWNGFGTTIAGQFRYKSVKAKNWHIDYVWVPTGTRVNQWRVSSGPNVRTVKVGTSSYPFFSAYAPLPSDHSPVVALVTFPANIPLGTDRITLGGHLIKGQVYRQWLAAGGQQVLGVPVSDEVKVSAAGVNVYRQVFSKGEVLFSSQGSETFTYPDGPTVPSVDNFRDALGPAGLKPGLVFRAAALMTATNLDQARLSAVLAGGAVVDLRTADIVKSKADPALPGVTFVNVPVNADAIYSKYVTEADRRSQFATVLRKVASAKGPVLIHCAMGTDRTGWAVAMLQYAAGLPDAAVRAEYVKSAAAKPAEFDAAIALAKSKYGSMQGYLTVGLGLTPAEVAALKAKLA